jgi:hypothetical protein
MDALLFVLLLLLAGWPELQHHPQQAGYVSCAHCSHHVPAVHVSTARACAPTSTLCRVCCSLTASSSAHHLAAVLLQVACVSACACFGCPLRNPLHDDQFD